MRTGYDDGMARRLFQFDSPDRFVAGAIGEPGDRTFYLQARKAGAVVTVTLEKAQVAALAARIEDVLAAIGEPVPDAPLDEDEDAHLTLPVDDAFRVGPMALGWDATSAQLVIEAQPESETADFVEVPDDADGPDTMRVRLAASAARAFARSAAALVQAGRPACPFCGRPLEPSGHFCLNAGGILN